MNGILLKIMNNRDYFSSKELEVANAIIRDPGLLLSSTIIEYAEHIKTSPATVTRFCKRMNISGFQELKLLIARAAKDEEVNIGSIESDESKSMETKYKERLDKIYSTFESVPYPKLKIRRMTTRWGVCNKKDKSITLNSELIKMDLKYLDYVIVHELSHFIYFDHSKNFWATVSKYCPKYKELRKEMRE